MTYDNLNHRNACPTLWALPHKKCAALSSILLSNESRDVRHRYAIKSSCVRKIWQTYMNEQIYLRTNFQDDDL